MKRKEKGKKAKERKEKWQTNGRNSKRKRKRKRMEDEARRKKKRTITITRCMWHFFTLMFIYSVISTKETRLLHRIRTHTHVFFICYWWKSLK